VQKDGSIIHRKETRVGPKGDVVHVGGCKLTIPEGALDKEYKLQLTSYFKRNDKMVQFGVIKQNRFLLNLYVKWHYMRQLEIKNIIFKVCFM